MAGAPTTGHTAQFRPHQMRSEPDGRMYSAVFEKNAQPVIDGLLPFLADRNGRALEIGSGTGQHVQAFAWAFPGLIWTPSEPDAIHRASIDAWRDFYGQVTETAIALDAASDWANSSTVRQIAPLELILSLNVIHISPIAVLQGILGGAAKALAPGGMLAFYGPFTEAGRHTGDGNAMFDARLKADNPDWGLRDTDDICAFGKPLGLAFKALVQMPSNNRLLVLARA